MQRHQVSSRKGHSAGVGPDPLSTSSDHPSQNYNSARPRPANQTATVFASQDCSATVLILECLAGILKRFETVESALFMQIRGASPLHSLCASFSPLPPLNRDGTLAECKSPNRIVGSRHRASRSPHPNLPTRPRPVVNLRLCRGFRLLAHPLIVELTSRQCIPVWRSETEVPDRNAEGLVIDSAADSSADIKMSLGPQRQHQARIGCALPLTVSTFPTIRGGYSG